MAPKRSPEGPHPAYCGIQQERQMTAEESPTVNTISHKIKIFESNYKLHKWVLDK